MMALRISIFIIVFSALLSSPDLNLFTYTHSPVSSLTASDVQSNTPDILNYSSNTVNIYIFGDILHVLNTFAIVIGNAILPAPMLVGFGIPLSIAVLINILCWVFYGLAVGEIVGNRSERLMR